MIILAKVKVFQKSNRFKCLPTALIANEPDFTLTALATHSGDGQTTGPMAVVTNSRRAVA